VGNLDRDRVFVERLRSRARELGVSDRVRTTGPLTGPTLATAYAEADVLVLASRGETYGMVVTEALARGLPVIASSVGGLPEALGLGPEGNPPGLLVPPEAPEALAGALGVWLGDTDRRRSLRHAAEQRRATLSGWSSTADRVARVIAEVA
jgi:glycosyltransferase involved in cell wall biosynthesis